MKMVSVLALAASALAYPAPAQAPIAPVSQEVLSGDRLQAIANQMRAFVPRDEFDTAPALPSVSGRRFSYMVTPLRRGPENMICDGFPSWGYWPQDGRLEVGAAEGFGIQSDFRTGTSAMFPTLGGRRGSGDFVSFRSLSCEKTRQPSYTATNGFGAHFTIDSSREVVTAIGEFEMINTSWRTYWTTQVAGDDARQLSQSIRVRISGTLADWAPGRPVLCGQNHKLPTARLPRDETLEICIFKGVADLFEVVDSRTDQVLFSSPR